MLERAGSIHAFPMRKSEIIIIIQKVTKSILTKKYLFWVKNYDWKQKNPINVQFMHGYMRPIISEIHC